MPRFRSVPSAVHDSPEWLTTTALSRMAHRALRPSAGRLELPPARESEPTWETLQRKAAECGAFFTVAESQEIVAGAVSSGLWLAPEGGGLVIPAFPPSFEREREGKATGEGSRGGRSAAERMRAHRAVIAAKVAAEREAEAARVAAAQEAERVRQEALREAAEREAIERIDTTTRGAQGLTEASLGAHDDASRTAASDTAQLSLLAPQGRAGVVTAVTVSEPVTGRQPEAPRPTPPGPPKGGQGGRGPGAVAATELEIGERSAAELKALDAAAVGDLARRILGRAEAVFAPEASERELRNLGRVVQSLGYPELELRAISTHWKRNADSARALFSHAETVRKGGRITVGLLTGKPDAKGLCDGKGLRSAREVAIPWAQKDGVFERFAARRPGVVAARTDDTTNPTAEAR